MNDLKNTTLLESLILDGKLPLGAQRKETRGGTREVLEPATGKSLGLTPIGDAEDMREAVGRAHAAQRAWAAVPPRERAAIMRRAGQVFETWRTKLTQWVARETGSIQAKGERELCEASEICFTADGLARASQGDVLPSRAGRLSVARRVPRGVVGVISPFNFPLILSIRSVAPALALGNAVVLKPDPRTPVTGGFLIGEVFRLAGLPEGVLQVLPGDGEAGEALVVDSRVAMIAFTGSPHVGRRIGALAGEHLKKVSLELGGANSLIILDDADLDLAASAAAFGAWFHQGQICMASNRVLVHQSIEAPLRERLVAKAKALPVGDGALQQVALGPMIDAKQSARFEKLIQDSVAQGARLEAGGTRDGLFHHPTVLSGVKPGVRSFDEEPFGPVLNLVSFRDDDHAVELANTGEGGLAAGVLSRDVGRAMRLGERLQVGLLHINDQTVNDEVCNPFGGFGIGGNGAAMGGPADIDEYTRWQWLTVQDRPPQYPF
jgi:benzaldehyde dehydrogenase (NAD)